MPPIIEPLCASATVETLGELTINDVSMHIDGAWNVTNPQVLWTPNAVKGTNRNKPRTRGTRANPYRIAESTYSLDMLLDGTWDVGENDWSASPWVGLQHNLEYLFANVVNPPLAPNATVVAMLDMPDGNVYEGAVQPRTLIHQGTQTTVFTAVLTVTVPGGSLVPTTS